jgi:hypothetical protein
MNERIKALLEKTGAKELGEDLYGGEFIGAVRLDFLEKFAELIAVDALRAKLTTEILTWHPADQPPDADLLVMMGDQYGWRAGYWDGEQWRDEENMVVTLVTHWARPDGPCG